jgi:hypothetical protein
LLYDSLPKLDVECDDRLYKLAVGSEQAARTSEMRKGKRGKSMKSVVYR